MFKDNRYINAGENEIYRYGKKAQEKAMAYLTPNENGFFTIPADGGKYWTIGTSNGKYGGFAKFKNSFLSVNRSGNVWAKAGTEKEMIFKDFVNGMVAEMKRLDKERMEHLEYVYEQKY